MPLCSMMSSNRSLVYLPSELRRSIFKSASGPAYRGSVSLHKKTALCAFVQPLPLSYVISVESEGFHLHDIQQPCLSRYPHCKYCRALPPLHT